MARFGLCGPSYRSQSLSVDCQTLMNFVLESVESQMGRGAFALYPTPGLNQLWQLGSAPMRGLTTVQGRTVAIQGTNVWELFAGGNSTLRGNVASDGRPVSLAGGPTQLLMASQQIAYVLDLGTNLTTPVAQLANIPILQVAYSDGFGLALTGQTPGKIQSSGNPGAGIDLTQWPGNQATIPSVFSDNPVGIFLDHRNLWVFGPKATQPYYDSGNFPFPFDIIDGALIETGLAAPFSVAKLDNSIFWLGADERGQGIVWRANGFQPVRVSNHAIEFAIQGYATIADAVAYSYQDQGHSFYVLSFPTAQKTWVYDAAVGQWHERGYWNLIPAKFTQHRAMFHTFNFGMHLVGDPTTGNVYQMSIPVSVGSTYQFVTDNGNPIRRLRRAPHISQEQEWLFHQQLQVDVETGLGPVPALQGTGITTTFYLADSTGVIWAVTVNDVGVLQATPAMGTPSPQVLFFNDSAGDGTSWQVTVSTLGVLQPIPAATNTNNPQSLQMVSSTGLTVWKMLVTDVGSGLAIIKTSKDGIFARGPQMMLRWSNDSAHTFSNEYTVDCGQAGDYTRRAIWRRLGKARDRVYEIAVTDPIPWRIVDAYLKATGYTPQKRIPKELAERA